MVNHKSKPNNVNIRATAESKQHLQGCAELPLTSLITHQGIPVTPAQRNVC